MNTTAMLVDILVVGFQVFIWILGFTFSFFIPPHVIKPLVSNSPGGTLFLVVIISYSLGIIFDYIIAICFSKFKSKKELDVYKDVSIVKIIASDKEVHKLLNNQYERLRISRGTLFNLPFITLSICCCIYNINPELKMSTLWSIVATILIGTLFTILAFISWKKRNTVYLEYINQTKNLPWYKAFLLEELRKNGS
jgi:hypothetical protein